MMTWVLVGLVLVVAGVVIDWRFPAELPQHEAPQKSAAAPHGVPLIFS